MDNVPYTYSYEAVAASQTAQVMGATGAVGDLLERVIVTVGTPATGTVSIADGNGSAIPIMPATTLAGCYVIELRMRARNATTPGWKITTGAGATAIGIGQFT
jgi:hypothetical protein